MVQKLDKRNGKYSFRYFDIDGHFRRHTCSSLSKKEAELEQLQFLSDLEKSKSDYNGKYNINTLLWKDFCKLFLNHCSNTKTDIASYKYVIKKINELFPDIKYLKDFNRQKIEEFRTKRQREVSQSTVNRNMHCIKSMWTYAVNDLELNCKNQAKGISDFPIPLTRKIIFFTIEQKEKILNEIRPRLKPIVYLCFAFGLRLKEAVNLTWDDVNFNTNRILIHPFKTFKHNPDPVSLPMPTDLIKYLKTLKKTSLYISGAEYTGRTKLANLSADIKAEFHRIVGFGTAHICRHTFITHAKNNPNIKESDIMEIARISNPKILKAYGHYTKEREETIINNIYNTNTITPEDIDKKIKELLKLKSEITVSK